MLYRSKSFSSLNWFTRPRFCHSSFRFIFDNKDLKHQSYNKSDYKDNEKNVIVIKKVYLTFMRKYLNTNPTKNKNSLTNILHMRLLIISIIFIIAGNCYSQGMNISNSAPFNVYARIVNPSSIGYNPDSAKFSIESGGNALYYLQSTLPDTMVNLLTGKKVAVKCGLETTTKESATDVKVKTTFIIKQHSGIYINKDTAHVIMHYN